MGTIRTNDVTENDNGKDTIAPTTALKLVRQWTMEVTFTQD